METLFFIINIITMAFFLDKYIDWKIALRDWQNDLK